MAKDELAGTSSLFGRFPRELWNLRAFRELPPETRGLLVMLHVHSEHYPPGLICQGEGALEDELGFSREILREHLAQAEAAGLLRYDPGERLILLARAAYPPANPDQAKGWLARALAYSDSELLAEYLAGLLEQFKEKSWFQKIEWAWQNAQQHRRPSEEGDSETKPSKAAAEAYNLYLKAQKRVKRINATRAEKEQRQSVTDETSLKTNLETSSSSSSSSASAISSASARSRAKSQAPEAVGVGGSSLKAAASTSPEAAIPPKGERAPLEPIPPDFQARAQELIASKLPRVIAMDSPISARQVKRLKELWTSEGWRFKHLEAALENLEPMDWLPDTARRWIGAMRRLKDNRNPSVFAVGKGARVGALERKGITLRFEGTEAELLHALPDIRAAVEAAFAAEWETVELLEPQAEAAGA